MSTRTNQPAIRGWQSQPPAGGWPFTFTAENGQRFPLKGFSAQQVVDNLNNILKLNGWFISDSHTWAIANGVWTSKDPQRALAGAVTIGQLPGREEFQPVRSQSGDASHWDTKPERYGPLLWGAINMYGAVFDKHAWDNTIRYVAKVLSPQQSPSTGCAKCHESFRDLCRQHPPDAVHNEQQAAEWAFILHNKINEKIGKLPMTWKAAAKRFAWRVAL